MSGLCAVLFRDPRRPEDVRHLLDRMVSSAPHRAAGGVTEAVDQRGGLVQMGSRGGVSSSEARGAAGLNPAWDRRLHRHDPTGIEVAVDARIDNRDELSSLLGVSRHLSDAQLLTEGYLRWGEGFARFVLGDFAVALRDPRRHRLVLARDAMAMRPVFYRVEPDRVLAASEVKQILALPGVPRQVNETMAAAYLVGVFGDPGWSYWDGVSQLPPAHVLVAGPGSVRVSRYWDVDPGIRITYPHEEDYARHLRDILLEAARCRLPEDAPLGIFLSGGLDSGVMASTAGWLRERGGGGLPHIHAYSWDYGPLKECDERERSAILVNHFGFQSRDVAASDAGPLAGYPWEPFDLDDPFHGHFQTLLDRGMRAAADDGVGRLATGMRGDLAVGPTHMDYRTLRRARSWGGLLQELQIHRRATGDPMGTLLRRHLPANGIWRDRRALLRGFLRPQGERSPGSRTRIPPWVHPDFAHRVRLADVIDQFDQVRPPDLEGPLRRARYQWLFTPMIQRWAVSHERRASRFGLEAIDLWSDRRIVEFVSAIPQQVMDLSFSMDKRLVRMSMKGIMPEVFRTGAAKTLPRSLFESGLRGRRSILAQDLLRDMSGCRKGWVLEPALRSHLQDFLGGNSLRGDFWWAVSLEWWLRRVDSRV